MNKRQLWTALEVFLAETHVRSRQPIFSSVVCHSMTQETHVHQNPMKHSHLTTGLFGLLFLSIGSAWCWRDFSQGMGDSLAVLLGHVVPFQQGPGILPVLTLCIGLGLVVLAAASSLLLRRRRIRHMQSSNQETR